MAWDEIGEGRYGGDAPFDAYGKAAGDAASRFEAAIGRKPRLAEVVEAFDRTAPQGASASFDALRGATEGDEPSTRRPPRLETGELVALPYAEGRAVVGLVLFGEERKDGPGYGPCLVALDLEVDALDTLDRARTARWLTRPFHPGSRTALARVGRVVLEPDAAFLPCFLWYAVAGRTGFSAAPFPGAEPVVLDYFDRRVPDDRAHRAGVIPASIGGAFTVGIRAARGLHRELPWSSLAPSPDALATPLAHLPPFVAPPPKRSRKKKPIAEAHDALRGELAALFRAAAEDCDEEWRDDWDRPPDREELAHALTVVLRADPDAYLSDPGRAASLARAEAQPERMRGPYTLEWRTRDDVEYVALKGPEGRGWSAFPGFDQSVPVVDVMGEPDDVVDAVLHTIVPAWRERGAVLVPGTELVVRRMQWGDPLRLRVA